MRKLERRWADCNDVMPPTEVSPKLVCPNEVGFPTDDELGQLIIGFDWWQITAVYSLDAGVRKMRLLVPTARTEEQCRLENSQMGTVQTPKSRRMLYQTDAQLMY